MRAPVLRDVDGGVLVQSPDDRGPDADFQDAKTVTKRPPTTAEMADLRFAWAVCKHVKSNAIVLAKDGMVVGVGAGQMSRVDSVHMAVRKAGERVKGSVLASDAFFPFRDNVDEAAKAGVTAVVQPGGSMRDADSIAACDEHGLAMVFTGFRHFRHRNPTEPCHDQPAEPLKRILFVCVENSNRSQMAEAFARLHGAGRIEAYSAGSRPSGKVNPAPWSSCVRSAATCRRTIPSRSPTCRRASSRRSSAWVAATRAVRW